MSGQSSCDPKRMTRERNRFLCYGALSIALAVGFGYSMASIKYQESFVTITESAAKERGITAEAAARELASAHRRYMRQMNAKDKEIKLLREKIEK